MTARTVAGALGVGLLLAACGRGERGQLATRVETPTPAPAEALGVGKVPGTAAPGTSPTPTVPTFFPPRSAGGPTPTPAPVPSAPPGSVNRPRPGTYVYALEGTRRSPETGNADRPYPQGATLNVELAAQGEEYTTRTSTPDDPRSTTSRTRREPGRVLLLQVTLSAGPFGTFECTYQPPVEVLHLPVKVETFPTQSGSNAGCTWRVDIAVLGQETVTDALGRSWRTWKIRTQSSLAITGQAGTVDGQLDGVSWLSPDLGIAVKSDNRSSGTALGGEFASHQVTLLRSYP